MSAPSPRRSVAITGMSALSPLGDSPEMVHDALCAGRVAHRPAPELGGAALATLSEFDPERYARVRGMRMYNRTTRLAICASKLALGDAGLDLASCPSEELGLLMASTSGHLDVLVQYDRSLVTNGTQRTNGALMPLAIPSAPGAIVALACSAKAFVMTLSDGGTSSLDALGLGARWVASGRARACVVVSAFSPSAEISRAIARSGALAPAGDVRPFDRGASGAALGEGAVAFVLERTVDAETRGARARAYVGGFGAAFSPAARWRAGLERACRAALEAAHTSRAELSLVSAAASGRPALDRAEAAALSVILGDHAAQVPVTAVQGALGDTFDAAGAAQTLLAIASIERREAPPIPGLEEPAVPGIRYLRRSEPLDGRSALVTALAEDGSCSALVLLGGSEG